jgi:hypothetical protein
MSKKILVGVGIVIVIVVSAIALMVSLFFGYVYIGVKQPAQKIAVNWQVCDSDIVKQYNETLTNAQSMSDITSKQKAITDTITSKPNYTKDATCNYIVLAYYVNTNNTSQVDATYTALVDSYTTSVLSTDFVDYKSPSQMKTSIDIYKYNQNKPADNSDQPNG